ncbi:hypothetical protein E4U53_005860 [Claviceps sorghi]|nr:hypothetical protein E4U53_005860 [Claviceps sorghi]
MSNAELASSYAALILADDGVEITADKLQVLIKAANVEVEPIWTSIFAKALVGKDLKDLLVNVGSGGGAAAPAAGGAAAAGGDAAPAEEEKKEEGTSYSSAPNNSTNTPISPRDHGHPPEIHQRLTSLQRRRSPTRTWIKQSYRMEGWIVHIFYNIPAALDRGSLRFIYE